jgi:carboxyl-terminal processing protease
MAFDGSLRARRLVLAVAAALVLCGSAAAQIRILPAGSESNSRQIDSLLRRGQQLETERRWGEALTLYEDALREHPGEPVLGTRHDLAKMHFDLSRRYNDSSFLRAVGQLNDREALTLYSEVLLKIQSHYVNEPDWDALTRRGALDLYVALGEAAYCQNNLRGKSRPEIEAYRQQLQQRALNRRVTSRQDAVDAANLIAQMSHRHLGLAPSAAILEFACAAVGGLDQYSTFLTSDQLNDVYSQIEGNFVGLGIELKASDGALLIVKVIAGSPAERAGIRAGDRITAVGDRSTADLTTDQAADLLQGEEGSTVEVTANSPGQQPRRVRVRREHVDVPSIEDVKILDATNGIGYIKLPVFQKSTGRDLDAALWKLHREGMKSLIIDVRNNPGGLLTAAVEVVDKFVGDGVIVSTRGRSSLEDYNYTAHKAGTWHIPLVVLIDGDSASASEIFAGAVRDHRRGTLVGQRTYGKGSVQGIFPLTLGGSGVRLTTAKFYSPNNTAISNNGVKPDVEVHRVAKGEMRPADDAALSAAIQAAQSQVVAKR